MATRKQTGQSCAVGGGPLRLMARRSHRAFAVAGVLAALAAASTPRPIAARGNSGITPVPCAQQDWQFGNAAFEALRGAKAYFGRYDGGLYRIEIPDRWNGELVLFAHGYLPNTGQKGSALRVVNHPIRDHLIREDFAWAASSYRCNGYVPGQGLLDTMALTDRFTKTSGGSAPRRTYLTGESMGGQVTILGLHRFPTAFAGGLTMCAAAPELFDFFAGVAAATSTATWPTPEGGLPIRCARTIPAASGSRHRPGIRDAHRPA